MKLSKKILLIILAIFLIIATSYRLKLLVVAGGEDSGILTSEEKALIDNTVTNSTNIINEVQDENLNLIENKIENQVESQELEKEEVIKEETSQEEEVLDTKNSQEQVKIDTNTSSLEESKVQEEELNNKELSYSDSNLKVTVSAINNDSLKGIKEVKVTPILEDSVNYSEITKKLENKVQEDNIKNNTQNELAGFLAYDIKLIDQEGSEKEPDGSVNVSFEYINIPNEVKENKDSNISVIHFENQTNLKEYTLDDEAQNLKIEKNSSNEVTKFELETDSFSTFTITWTQNSINYAKIVFHYINSHGQEIDGNSQNLDIAVTTDMSPILISDYASKEITSNGVEYEFQGTHYDKIGGTEFDEMTFTIGKDAVQNLNNPKDGDVYNVTFYNKGQEVANLDYSITTRAVDIYLVYIYKLDKVSITDTIMQNGCLNAVLKDDNGNDIDKKGYTFKWYRTSNLNGENTSWEEVKQMIAGDEYIISDDGSSLNIVLNQGANKYYKVEAIDKDNKVIASEEYHIPYFDDVQNGGFESPEITDKTKVNGQFANDTVGLYWKTTGIGVGEDQWHNTRDGHDIEIVNGRANISGSFNIDKVKGGQQCAELNCEAEGALYQDVLTIPGQNLSWSLAHRARGPRNAKLSSDYKDSMYVIIMSTELAEKYDITDQDKVKYILDKATPKVNEPHVYKINENEIFIQKITDSNETWGDYQGNFTIPKSQYLTRFFFVAAETASGNATMGNFLDDVKVGQNIDTRVPGYVTVNITKNIKGVPENKPLTNYNITINNINGEKDDSENLPENDIEDISKIISSSSYRWDSENNCWTQTVQIIIDLKKETKVKSSFAEANFKNLKGYDYIGSEFTFEQETLNSDGLKTIDKLEGEGSEVSDLNLENETIYNLTFTNTYKKKLASIKLEKIGKEYFGNDETIKALKDVGFTITNPATGEEIGKYLTDDNGFITVSNLDYDNLYKLEETTTPEGFYPLKEEVYFKINSEDEKVILTDSEGNSKEYSNAVLNDNNIQITNIAHTTLPKAGGIGTTIFTVVGVSMMVMAVIAIAIYKKQDKKKE